MLWHHRRASPGQRMDTQILLLYFCAAPLQTLVEARFNFCLHFLSLRQLFCLFPPTHPWRPHLFLVGSADHPPDPRSAWVVLYGCVPVLLEALIALFGRVQHYHRFPCQPSEVLSGRLISPPGPGVESVSRCEQGWRPHQVQATTALLEGRNLPLSPALPVFGDTVPLPSQIWWQYFCALPLQTKAFAIIQHLSTAMSALHQCLDLRPMRPFLPLSTTRRLCTVVVLLPHPAAPHAHAPTPVQGPLPGRACDNTWRWND